MKKACGKWVWNAFLSNAFTKEILLFKIPLCYFPWNAHWWLIYLAWPLGSNREMALIFSVVKKTVNGTHLSWWHYMSLYSIWESSLSFLMPSHSLSKIISWHFVFVAVLLPSQLGFLGNCLFSSGFFQVQVLFLAFFSCPISCLSLAAVWVGNCTRKSDNESKIIIFKTSVLFHCDVI